MGEDTDRYRAAVEAGVLAEFGCAECDAERVAAAVTRVRDDESAPDWSPSFVAARLTDAPKGRSVPEKWNWLLDYAGTDDLAEYRLDC